MVKAKKIVADKDAPTPEQVDASLSSEPHFPVAGETVRVEVEGRVLSAHPSAPYIRLLVEQSGVVSQLTVTKDALRA